jgi:sortase A
MKRSIIGIALILIGLSVISTALFMRYSADRKQKAMIVAFEKTIENVDKQQPSDNSTETPADSSPDKKPPSQNINGAIGIMTIPKIDLKVAIGEGVDNETLKYAVGHFDGTGMPGEKGNFAVAGHRSYTYSQYFNRLDEIKVGDEIEVQTKKGDFVYKVY